MHSLEIKQENDDPVIVFHNGDFSGDVTIELPGSEVGYDIPFEVLKAIVGTWLKREALARLEDADPILFLRSLDG